MSQRPPLNRAVLGYFTASARNARAKTRSKAALFHRLLMADARELGWWPEQMEVLMALCLAENSRA